MFSFASVKVTGPAQDVQEITSTVSVLAIFTLCYQVLSGSSVSGAVG